MLKVDQAFDRAPIGEIQADNSAELERRPRAERALSDGDGCSPTMAALAMQ